MTDPGTADRTYIGPMTPELVEQILDKVGFTLLSTNEHEFRSISDQSCTIWNSGLNMACMVVQERPEAILPTMGGQTALNLAKALAEVS